METAYVVGALRTPIVTKNGREVGRFIPKDAAVSYLTDSLTGILKNDDSGDARDAALRAKYEIDD